MSAIELVCALLSFVYALGLTHLLQSASELWVARDRLRVSVSLMAWMVLSVLMLVNNWLALIPLAQGAWSAVAVLVGFATAVIQYFTCSLASMKVFDDGAIDMRAYEDRHGVGYKVAYVALSIIVLLANAIQFEDWAGQGFPGGSTSRPVGRSPPSPPPSSFPSGGVRVGSRSSCPSPIASF